MLLEFGGKNLTWSCLLYKRNREIRIIFKKGPKLCETGPHVILGGEHAQSCLGVTMERDCYWGGWFCDKLEEF